MNQIDTSSPLKSVAIFGATSAIAKETARLWASQGAALFLVARDAEKLAVLAADLKARGAQRVEIAVADLAQNSVHQQLVTDAQAKLGTLTTVLLAWGTLSDQKRCEQSYAETEKELQTNFLSYVSLLTILATLFESKKSGSIVVISSVAGDRGRQSNYVYGTAKGALSLFCQGMRNRLFKSGVALLTVKPGFVDTPMTNNFKKGPLFVKAEVIAQGIVNAERKGKDSVYLPWFWFFIMSIICAIPEKVFKRLKL